MIKHYDKGRASLFCLLVDMAAEGVACCCSLVGRELDSREDQIEPSRVHRKTSALHGLCRLTEGLSSCSFPMTNLNTPSTCSEQWNSGVGDLQKMLSLAEAADPVGRAVRPELPAWPPRPLAFRSLGTVASQPESGRFLPVPYIS